jgi:hypothetical protein
MLPAAAAVITAGSNMQQQLSSSMHTSAAHAAAAAAAHEQHQLHNHQHIPQTHGTTVLCVRKDNQVRAGVGCVVCLLHTSSRASASTAIAVCTCTRTPHIHARWRALRSCSSGTAR